MITHFEKERTAFIAALVRGDIATASALLTKVQDRVRAHSRIFEADQKAVNQMLVAAKKLDARFQKTDRQHLQKRRKQLKTALAQVARSQVHQVAYTGYRDWQRKLGLDEARYQVMLQNVAACQLSVGCSNFCRRCNEWALAGVRGHFTFEAAQQIVKKLDRAGNDRYALYSASDPLDYRCGGRTIADLLRNMQGRGYRTQFGLLTKVPKGSERLARQFLEAGVDIAVSLTEKNRSRVARIEARAGKQFSAHHDTADLLIPAGLDEDFATVKSSVTDNYGIEITPEGATMVIPTFTSALNPTGQCRLPVTAATDWFIKKRVGRDALPVEYYKPLKVVRPDGTEGVLDRLLAPQVENVLLDNGNRGATPPGMMDLAEYLKTFDPAVARHRKKLAPVAIANLRRQVHANAGGTKGDREALDRMFARKKRDYLDFCDPEKVLGFKRKAVSYLLAAAADYLKTHPSEREIIRYLRRKDVAAVDERFGGAGRIDIADRVADFGAAAFDSFSSLLFRLLADPADGALSAFLAANPAGYDPDCDRFVQRP